MVSFLKFFFCQKAWGACSVFSLYSALHSVHAQILQVPSAHLLARLEEFYDEIREEDILRRKTLELENWIKGHVGIIYFDCIWLLAFALNPLASKSWWSEMTPEFCILQSEAIHRGFRSRGPTSRLSNRTNTIWPGAWLL